MIDIVIISNAARMDLFEQTLQSMSDNAYRGDHSVTIVLDNPEEWAYQRLAQPSENCKFIVNVAQNGASRSRNIGASSIPTYRRKSYVMFSDDDCYYCPGWDKVLMGLADTITDHHFDEFQKGAIVSGHEHPFNHAEKTHIYGQNFGVPVAISTVNMLMPWGLWDDVGFFTEPGGAGGSEDVDYCNRARAKGYGLAVVSPNVVIHTGLHSSSGAPIVGHDQVIAKNREVERTYGYNLSGKVQYS